MPLVATAGFPLGHAADESLVLDVQSALWNSGLVRRAGAVEILIAAYANINDATVLTADHHLDHIGTGHRVENLLAVAEFRQLCRAGVTEVTLGRRVCGSRR